MENMGEGGGVILSPSSLAEHNTCSRQHDRPGGACELLKGMKTRAKLKCEYFASSFV